MAAAWPAAGSGSDRGRSAGPTSTAARVAFFDDADDGGRGMGRYQPLGEQECQCLAAGRFWLANLTEMEGSCSCDADPCGLEGLQQVLMRCRVADHRNRAAGEALEAYYRLAEAEAKRELLAAATAELVRTAEQLQLLKERGLRVEADEDEFERQLLDLEVQRAELDLAIGQLNGKLRVLLDADCGDPKPFWPDFALTSQPVNLDADEEIARGLSMRPDLAGLRIMRRRLNKDTMPAARSTMMQMDLALGSPLSKGSWLHCREKKARRECEMRMRCASWRSRTKPG